MSSLAISSKPHVSSPSTLSRSLFPTVPCSQVWLLNGRILARDSKRLILDSSDGKCCKLFIDKWERRNFVKSLFHSVEKWKIYCHPKKFRQINSLVFTLVKTLLSRNFCQKSVTVNFRNFHTVRIPTVVISEQVRLILCWICVAKIL